MDERAAAGERAVDEGIWYAAYGSNTHGARLACYLEGGRPAGALRVYPGARDPAPPVRSAAVELSGAVYFATHSPVWGGGRAFYDPEAGGRALARAHLITAEQFSDIAAQEMYGEPGADLDLTEVLETGRCVLGPGRYQTLVRAGFLDGRPLLTLTAPWSLRDVPWTAPSAAYMQHLSSGLREAGTWGEAVIARYLAACPGAAGHWTAEGGVLAPAPASTPAPAPAAPGRVRRGPEPPPSP